MEKILQKLGIEVSEEMTPEELNNLIENKIDEQNEKIKALESEKDNLSKANEELVNSVEGYKIDEEKLTKELSDTKEKLSKTEGKLEQVTVMYKDYFTRDSDEQGVNEETKDNKKLGDDVLQNILDA